MSRLERDLSAFYDQDAADRAQRPIDPSRVAQRDAFIRLLLDEQRGTLLEIGTGPGREASTFAGHGIAPVGVDLSFEHARLAADNGVASVRASVLRLPFAARSFDSGWTMSTLLHIPDSDVGQAMDEIVRVLRPGAPLAVGLWGGRDHEGISDFDTIAPPRFFSLRSHDRARAMLAAHGEIERFETWPDDRSTWEYQFAVVRIGGG